MTWIPFNAVMPGHLLYPSPRTTACALHQIRVPCLLSVAELRSAAFATILEISAADTNTADPCSAVAGKALSDEVDSVAAHIPLPLHEDRLCTVARNLNAQADAKVQLSRYDRGIGTTLVKNTEQATKPLVPLLASSNYSKLTSTTFDTSTAISDDVHLWQESIRQIHDCAHAFDMLAIFMIPDVFTTLSYDSCASSTKLIDSIEDFNNPILTDTMYFDWQTYLLQFGTDVELQSDTWMIKLLKSSMEPTLYMSVMVKYDTKPKHQQGSITLFRLIINQMVLQSKEARRHLLHFVEDFDIHHYPGEDVSLDCVRLKEIAYALGADHLPSDMLSRVLEGFEKSTTETFRQMCSTL